MTANNDWPGKPGVPMIPEQDGWHWVENKFTGDRRAALWLTDLHWGLRVPTHEMAEACIYLAPCLTPDEATALQKRVAVLEGALKDAAASVKEWGAYASQYLQDKWDLPGEVARYIAIAEGKNDAALEGKKDE